MSGRLVLNIATRGRPALLRDTIEKTLRKVQDPNTVLMISADLDDPTMPVEDDKTYAISADFRGVAVNFRPREDTIAAKWNRAIEAFPDATVHMPMTDDSPILTPGFDRIVLEAAALFPDNIGMIYGPLVNASFPALIAMTAGFVNKLGYIYPEHFPYWFVDHWTDDLCRLIGRVSYVDVEVEQTQNIGVTAERREPGWWATFFDAGRIERRREARSIIDSPDFLEPEWRKKILRRHYPLIEYRSKWINDHVRHIERSGHMQVASVESGGDRYQRLKARAKETLRRWVAQNEGAESVSFEAARIAAE